MIGTRLMRIRRCLHLHPLHVINVFLCFVFNIYGFHSLFFCVATFFHFLVCFQLDRVNTVCKTRISRMIDEAERKTCSGNQYNENARAEVVEDVFKALVAEQEGRLSQTLRLRICCSLARHLMLSTRVTNSKNKNKRKNPILKYEGYRVFVCSLDNYCGQILKQSKTDIPKTVLQEVLDTFNDKFSVGSSQTLQDYLFSDGLSLRSNMLAKRSVWALEHRTEPDLELPNEAFPAALRLPKPSRKRKTLADRENEEEKVWEEKRAKREERREKKRIL
jgi:hypothetical protein